MNGESPAEKRVLEQIREEIEAADLCEVEQLTMNSTWEELDLDSIDLIEIASAMEDRLGIEIDDLTLRTFKTAGDAVRAILSIVDQAASAPSDTPA